MPHCVPIAHLSEYENDPFMVDLAKEAGRSEMVETCDVVARHGISIYTDASIEQLFVTQGGELASPVAVARNLRFYDAIPTTQEVDAAIAPHAKASEPEQWVRRLEFFYSALNVAHTRFHIPHFFPEEAGELKKAQTHLTQLKGQPAMAEQADDLAIALGQWICGSTALPAEFFATFARTLVINAYIGEARGVPNARSAVQECLAAALPIAARKRQLLNMLRSTHAVVVHIDLPKIAQPTRVGEVLPSTSLDKTIQKNRYTLLMAWAEWCGYCKQSLPQLRELQKALRKLGGGVVSFRHAPEVPAELKAIQRSGQIAWTDVELSNPDYSKLNTSDGVPYFLLVNSRREILYVSAGYSTTLKDEVMAVLKTKRLDKLHR